MLSASAGLRMEPSCLGCLNDASSLQSEAGQWGERACTSVVAIITQEYMQALNDLGMEHFLGIQDQLVLMVLSCTSGHQLLPAHH